MSVQTTVKTLWDKFTAWAKGEVVAVENFLSTEEQAVVAILQPILHNAEVAVLSNLIAEARVFLLSLTSVGSLADIESAILNVWQTEKPVLFTFAKGLGSNVFQAILGLLLSQLPKIVAAV